MTSAWIFLTYVGKELNFWPLIITTGCIETHKRFCLKCFCEIVMNLRAIKELISAGIKLADVANVLSSFICLQTEK